MPHDFQGLDAVHILPLVDLDRLLVVLVTRSIELSNTQYSILLETDGRLITLSSEWIGSRVQYHKRAVCFSTMLATDDFDYTDYYGYNKDECEYFVNGFAVNDKIYLQSLGLAENCKVPGGVKLDSVLLKVPTFSPQVQEPDRRVPAPCTTHNSLKNPSREQILRS